MNNIDQKNSKLISLGISIEEVPGLINNENHNQEQIEALMTEMTKKNYSHSEIFGTYCQLANYIECPMEMAYEYCANVLSLNEWTFSMRNFSYIGGNVWISEERLGKNTFVYTKVDAYPNSHSVDYLCAWDQAFELWMRYYFRFIDAQLALNKPGTVVLWTNCKHPYYDRKTSNLPPYIKKGQNLTTRSWVGDFWDQFDAIHKIEMNNLKQILEYRFKSTQKGFI
jgi:hypothetical protein